MCTTRLMLTLEANNELRSATSILFKGNIVIKEDKRLKIYVIGVIGRPELAMRYFGIEITCRAQIPMLLNACSSSSI